uniref:(northern house mosquito) hypothetical protein n=1 Tax=Culex pipiens TaxID=7175 RepID=A0A8D8AFZ4_CULPI
MCRHERRLDDISVGVLQQVCCSSLLLMMVVMVFYDDVVQNAGRLRSRFPPLGTGFVRLFVALFGGFFLPRGLFVFGGVFFRLAIGFHGWVFYGEGWTAQFGPEPFEASAVRVRVGVQGLPAGCEVFVGGVFATNSLPSASSMALVGRDGSVTVEDLDVLEGAAIATGVAEAIGLSGANWPQRGSGSGYCRCKGTFPAYVPVADDVIARVVDNDVLGVGLDAIVVNVANVCRSAFGLPLGNITLARWSRPTQLLLVDLP